jgi:hypothetical protein
LGFRSHHAFKRLIIEKTEGNPFLIEETVQMLFDEGAMVRDGGAVKLTRSLNTLKIPPTVQGILAARIDRLPAEAKDLLQRLAVIGREFPISLERRQPALQDDLLMHADWSLKMTAGRATNFRQLNRCDRLKIFTNSQGATY